jgi:two-component system, OmpR family, sensor histidine kinase KdpD
MSATSPERTRPSTAASAASRARHGNLSLYGESVTVIALCTVLAWQLVPYFKPANLLMIYLLGIVVVATRLGRDASVLAAMLGILAFDFLFVPPVYTLGTSDLEFLFAFGALLAVALVISNRSDRLRKEAAERLRLYEDAERRREETEKLYAMSRELAVIRDVDSLLQAGLRHIGEFFGGRAAVALPSATGELETKWCYPETLELPPVERDGTQQPGLCRESADSGQRRVPDVIGPSEWNMHAFHLPLVASRGVIGALVLSPPSELQPQQLRMLETFANQIVLAVERAIVTGEAQKAQLQMETERLRNSLLSSISHDLRTPLAAITGAAASLLWRDERFDAETRHQLKETVYEEAKRLSGLVENLLSMTRLESGIQLRKELQPLEEVVGTALGRIEPSLAGRLVTTRLPHDLPLVALDEVLIEQVLINLLENAMKYTPPGSSLEVAAFEKDGMLTLEVADQGPGLDPGDEERIFEKFYRGHTTKAPGAGLGLAICRPIIQAHGGRIWAENRPGGGAVFRFTLPSQPASQRVDVKEA